MQTYAASRESLLFVRKKISLFYDISAYFLYAGTAFARFTLYTYTRHSCELCNNLNDSRDAVEALTSVE